MAELTYDHSYVIEHAVKVSVDDGNWSRTRISVKAGETAYVPGTTKKCLLGPAELQYDIHPTGIVLRHTDGGTRHAIIPRPR